MDNYKNCPLKKRPVFYVEPTIESSPIDDQPQDLSIKRKAEDDCSSDPKHFSLYGSIKTNIYSAPVSPVSFASESSMDIGFQNVHLGGISTPINNYTNGFMPYNLMPTGWNSFGQPSPSAAFSCFMTPPTSPNSLCSSEILSPRSDISSIHNDTLPSPSGGVKKCRFECDKCSKMYSTSAGLIKHQQFHCPAAECNQEKKQHACEECGKCYTTKGALKMHIKTHTLPCKCPICEKAFSRPWLLQGHMRTHTGEKPFSCTDCNRSFADRSNLRAHQQTHVDVKKYSCAVCNKSFSRMSLLNKHASTNCALTVV